jgi:hypothetical protein
MKSGGKDRAPELSGMRREKKTLEAMIRLYCRSLHGREDELCPDCRLLSEYAMERLDRCPFGEEKPTCANCTVHCYKPAMREKIRAVMRYAGPRMSSRHPILTLHHLFVGRRKTPSEK